MFKGTVRIALLLIGMQTSIMFAGENTWPTYAGGLPPMKILLENCGYSCSPRGDDKIVFSSKEPNFQIGDVHFDSTRFIFEVLSKSHNDATEDKLMECAVRLSLPIYFGGLGIASVTGKCIKLTFTLLVETVDANPEIVRNFALWKRDLDRRVNDFLDR
jgi:hypothetical protein